MTTDEVQKTGGRRAIGSDDDFSSEDYIKKPEAAPRGSGEIVILGTVPDEFPDAGKTGEPGSEIEVDGTDLDGDDTDLDGDDTAPDDTGTDESGDTEGSGQGDGNGSEPAVTDMAAEADPAESEVAPDETKAAATTDDGHLEMRQVAGLTAGSMMKLTIGRAFEFNESNDGGSFSLRVLENGEVVVHPGTAQAVVDEVVVEEPMLVGEALLNVSSACFSVRRPRPPASSESRMEAIGAAFASISPIAVPALSTEEPLAVDRLAGSRLGTIINRNPVTRGAIGRNAWDFLQSIRETRSVVAERHRLLHPDPEELKTRLSRLDPGLWERSREHPLFGRFGVGYANIPWEPKFDNPELIPELLHEPIVEMSLLPWVPVTANLLYGPLGIVGRRAARLAACRHAILSLAALSMPGEVQFAIRSGQNTSTSWNWARALPAVLSAADNSSYVVSIIDGPDGARIDEAAQQAAGETADRALPADADPDGDVADDPHPTGEVPVVRAEADDNGATDTVDDVAATAESTNSGYIVLADSVDELTRPCGTVLQIEPDGTGSVTNHLDETIQVTPIGVTEAFAHDMATRIADILTESFL